MVKSGESSVPGIVPAMEMVEQGQSQDKVSRKLIKIQHVREKEEEDRISALPDCLLLEILSRLPSTKGAIRTGTLSKRWKSIWTLLPILIFRLSDVTWDYVSFVDKTLTQCRQLKLKKLVLDAYSDTQFQSRLQNWIRYALTCNVEEFLLSLGSYDRSEFMLDRSFYTSSSFTSLTLGGCVLNPTGAIGWKNLRSLCISYAKLDEDLIENILSGSPVLETLVLKECLGYKLLNITSTSVKKVPFGYWKSVARDIIKINAPNILSLSIQDDLVLCKFLLLNVSSLVKVDLDYTPVNYRKRAPKEVQEEMLRRLILNLRHVKELKIGNFCSKVMSRLKAKGFDFPSNVKFPDEILV